MERDRASMQIDLESENDDDDEDEVKDEFSEDIQHKTCPPKMSRIRSPSFEGYFASKSGAISLQTRTNALKSNAEKIGEIQKHLEHMVSILREVDSLKMAVRIESEIASKKRYLTVVSSEKEHSAIIGIDWCIGQGPTIGLVLPVHSTTQCTLDGDGGFHVSKSSTINRVFKPVSVQTLWSARHVVEKGIAYARKLKYFHGCDTEGFLDYYENLINSDFQSISEWNAMKDCDSFIMTKVNLPADPDPEKEKIKLKIRTTLREVMRHMNLDEVSTRHVFGVCEKEMGMSLKEHKLYVNDQMLVVMGQMDSASKILDYLYLGSEWNASDLAGLKELGIGYILNITREVANFFHQNNIVYYNIRVYDEENVELLKHWDHTFRFIEKAREAGSKVLVHCRYGISRSASTVIAYLMKKVGWSMTRTIDFVVERRDIVQPNPGFTKQLIIYEGILNSSRNRFSSLFHQRSTPSVNQETTSPPDNRAHSKRHAFSSSRSSNEQTNDNDDETDCIDGEIEGVEMIDNCSTGDVSSESSSKLWESSGSQKLQRAMTMTSGAVFFDTTDRMKQKDDEDFHDNENEQDNIQKSIQNKLDDTEMSTKLKGERSEEKRIGDDDDGQLTDVTEDALMEQVVMATQRKTELLNSFRKLNEQDNNSSNEKETSREGEVNSKETDKGDIEFNLKPSTLRRLSKGSQILHLENIAKMKKRRSQTDFDATMEDKENLTITEMEGCGDVIGLVSSASAVHQQRSNNNVPEMNEIFTRRSKKHIREDARRRTFDTFPAEEEGLTKLSLTILSDSDDAEKEEDGVDNDRSFQTIEVDVSDLVQRHHQMIREKNNALTSSAASSAEDTTPRHSLQRHQSFPSADRSYHHKGVGGEKKGRSVSDVVQNMVVNFESKKDMDGETKLPHLNIVKKEQKLRPFSLNIDAQPSSDDISCEMEAQGRRRASTDVDLRSTSSVD